MKKSILLGMIYEKPMSGYQIYSILKKCCAFYKKISLSSLYNTLYEMEKGGLVTKKAKKEGRRPEKQVFEITEKGKKEFINELKEQLEDITPMADEFNWIIPFLCHLNKRYVKEVLTKRMGYFRNIEKELKKISAIRQEQFHRILMQRAITHVNAEIKWIRETIKQIGQERQ